LRPSSLLVIAWKLAGPLLSPVPPFVYLRPGQFPGFVKQLAWAYLGCASTSAPIPLPVTGLRDTGAMRPACRQAEILARARQAADISLHLRRAAAYLTKTVLVGSGVDLASKRRDLGLAHLWGAGPPLHHHEQGCPTRRDFRRVGLMWPWSHTRRRQGFASVLYWKYLLSMLG
jgi:hypothetical protein